MPNIWLGNCCGDVTKYDVNTRLEFNWIMSYHNNTLNELLSNLQVIMATNRADTLDPALLRPGRLDRKIEFPTPDRRQKRLIFSTITAKMNLSEEVDLEDCE